MKKLILLITGILTITTVFSQSTLKVKNDTLMCFNKNQLSFIVKDIISKNYNDSILTEANKQLSLYNTSLNVCKNTLDSTNLIINEYKHLVDTYKKDSIVVSKKVNLLENNNKDLKVAVLEKDKTIINSENKIKRLKFYNKITIAVSLLFIVLINIYF